MAHEITDQTFEAEVLQHPGLVLVDFWAPWCPPCQRLAPVLEALSKRFGPRLKVVKINTDQQREWAQRLRVSGIPALFFFHNGQLVARETGFIPESALAEGIEGLLKKVA